MNDISGKGKCCTHNLFSISCLTWLHRWDMSSMERSLLSNDATQPQDWCAGWKRVLHDRQNDALIATTSKHMVPVWGTLEPFSSEGGWQITKQGGPKKRGEELTEKPQQIIANKSGLQEETSLSLPAWFPWAGLPRVEVVSDHRWSPSVSTLDFFSSSLHRHSSDTCPKPQGSRCLKAEGKTPVVREGVMINKRSIPVSHHLTFKTEGEMIKTLKIAISRILCCHLSLGFVKEKVMMI